MAFHMYGKIKVLCALLAFYSASIKQMILDCRWQDWDDHTESSDRFSFNKTCLKDQILLNLTF